MIPAAERAGVPWARFHTLRHTCAALLIDAGASPLRLQRWMGHHSAAFTLDNYGHLIDDSLGPSLDLDPTIGAAVLPGEPGDGTDRSPGLAAASRHHAEIWRSFPSGPGFHLRLLGPVPVALAVRGQGFETEV